MSRTVKKSIVKSSRVYGGLDLSLTSAGVVFLDSKGNRIYSTAIQVKSSGAERLHEIYCILNRLLTRIKPTHVCVEGYSYASPFNREATAELGGVIRMLLFEHSIPFIVVQPTSLKMFILGKGAGSKESIMMLVYKQWGFTSSINDEADAYGLAKIAQALNDEGSVKLDAKQQKALSEIAMSKKDKTARKKQEKLEKAARLLEIEAKREARRK
jgi:Holliday junction resolvasome RuvABC endonuclease subunit